MKLIQLRQLVRDSLPDVDEWSNDNLDRMIGRAIRFYSAEFPRRWRHTLTLTTGEQAYDLPGGYNLLGVSGVEYPTGEAPPRFLYEVSERSAEFARGAAVYALRGADDATAIEEAAAVGSLVFGETVATGEFATVEYVGGHAVPTVGDNDAYISVPAAHLEAVTFFCRFLAQAELETDQALIVSSSSIVLAQLGESARSAWNQYKSVMDRLGYVAGHSSGYVDWGEVGGVGRIY